jgi:hypothetical protein
VTDPLDIAYWMLIIPALFFMLTSKVEEPGFILATIFFVAAMIVWAVDAWLV